MVYIFDIRLARLWSPLTHKRQQGMLPRVQRPTRKLQNRTFADIEQCRPRHRGSRIAGRVLSQRRRSPYGRMRNCWYVALSVKEALSTISAKSNRFETRVQEEPFRAYIQHVHWKFCHVRSHDSGSPPATITIQPNTSAQQRNHFDIACSIRFRTVSHTHTSHPFQPTICTRVECLPRRPDFGIRTVQARCCHLGCPQEWAR